MHNTHNPAPDNQPTATGDNSSPASRKPKGTGLPANVWLSPATEPQHDDNPRSSGQRTLPFWAVDRLAEEYLPAGYSVLHAEYREPVRTEPNPGDAPAFAVPEYTPSGNGPFALAIVEYQPLDSDPGIHTEWRGPGWHRVNTRYGTDQNLAKLFKTASNGLSGRGILAVAVARPTYIWASFTDHTSHVIRTARSAGFGYLQHLAVISTPATGDKFTADTETPGGIVTTERKSARVHGRIHHDVLIFTA
jgi:hypothetical protein